MTGGPVYGFKEQPDPMAVRTVSELAHAFQLLRGGRSYAELDKAVNPAHGRGPRMLPASTLNNVLHGKSVPTRETVVRFLTACCLDESARIPWLAAWERASTEHLHQPIGAVRAREARPRLLGVHASIQVEGGIGELPTYVPRDFDAELCSAIMDAATHGGFILLVGGSSVGKTRSLFEAIQATLPEWWLIHPDPFDTGAIPGFAASPTPRTVLWLDELQRYMDGGLADGTMRSLVGARTVVVATRWPGENADPAGLLGIAHVVDVPDALSGAERRRGEALDSDPRIRRALASPDAGFTQVLAAGPQLIRWWANAPATQCYGKAVITAAIDVRRVGVAAPLSRSLLEAAAPGYLTPSEQAIAPANWLDDALAYATTRLHGASATLSPVPAGMGRIAGYTVADYLYQHACNIRRTIGLPDVAWQAIVDHHDCGDTRRLADEAERRGRPIEAIALFGRVADAGAGHEAEYAANHLSWLLARQGRVDELRARADANDAEAAVRLAGLLASQGEVEEAIGILREQAAAVGNLPAGILLVDVLAEHGRVDELRERADAGDWYADMSLADLLRAQGRLDDLRELADTRGGAAAVRLAWSLAERGQVDELRKRADVGEEQAAIQLAKLLVPKGGVEEAIEVLGRLADAGGWNARRRLLDLLVEQGRIDDAVAVTRALVDAGDDREVIQLAQLLAMQGSVEEALSILRERVENFGERAAEHQLAKLLAAQGRAGELRERAAAGDAEAVIELANVLVGQGCVDEGVTTLRSSGSSSDPRVSERLTNLLVEHGRSEEAIAILRVLADAGVYHAAQRLSDLLAAQGRADDLTDEVAAGTIGALARLDALVREQADIENEDWDLDGPQ